jgi:sulfur-oxidizing protein SoxY
MQDDITLSILGRRTFVVSALAAAAAGFRPLSALAEDTSALTLERSQKFKDDFARLVGAATPIEGKIAVDLPDIAENGNFVPITMAVDSPMTEADHVTAIHLLSTANPVAHVATFRLSPINAVARVQSRMRLAKTQDVIVLAELSGGDMLISTTLVKVTIGGCAS